MRAGATLDYALRIVMYLAACGDVRNSREIAEEMSVPREFLVGIAQSLRSAGVISSRKGKHGGYLLARGPNEISYADVARAVGGPGKRGPRSGARPESPEAERAAAGIESMRRRLEEAEAGLTLGAALDHDGNHAVHERRRAMPKWRRVAGQDRFEKFGSGDLPRSAYEEAIGLKPSSRAETIKPEARKKGTKEGRR